MNYTPLRAAALFLLASVSLSYEMGGTGKSVHFARIHVHLRPAVFFPSRSIEIRISLQQTPNLPYAQGNNHLVPALCRKFDDSGSASSPQSQYDRL